MCSTIQQLRRDIRDHYLSNESDVIDYLTVNSNLTLQDRRVISDKATVLVEKVRSQNAPSLMEKFLAEYGLSTKEGVALMCLAEALLRVPDNISVDALIEDKVVPGNWQKHLGCSASSLVNSSTWGLLLTGKLLKQDDSHTVSSSIKSLVKRLGEPVVRAAVAQAMKELGSQFVVGRNIDEAVKRGAKNEKKGYTYSYDMLGEAAHTENDAIHYYNAYANAINRLARYCDDTDIRHNPGISVKLSALHARYEVSQRDRVMTELVDRTLALALDAKNANMGFNIDAEEADRLDLSLDVIEAVLKDERLSGWDGFGIVVQAFGLRASFVLDWFYQLAQQLNRKVMVRLVKGAYWDTEIKRAQVLGLTGFPVFTHKYHSDISYICCAEKLLAMTDTVYPQFATHNAHSCAAVLCIAEKIGVTAYEFQRLHGMGEAVHETLLTNHKTRCRIYAPVGAHKDLLAYLVRRLLENGANSSFVNQIVDKRIAPEDVAKDPFDDIQSKQGEVLQSFIVNPLRLYGEKRQNAKGWDITDRPTLDTLNTQREKFKFVQWNAKPIINGELHGNKIKAIRNPADPEEVVGHVIDATDSDIRVAISAAEQGYQQWSNVLPNTRAECLRRVADLFEQHAPELFALVCREAGKNLLDAIGEIREAVDFCRFYADEAERLCDDDSSNNARGIVTCISPWNFPLAIFTGQVLAAIAAGNSVLAKPAAQTPLIAACAVELMHQAGIPPNVLQLLPGDGASVGAALTSDPRISAVCFTGSTQTAQIINRTMAEHLSPNAPLVAETGGLNAMIVDSTALPEQVVRDVLMSAFYSAGQRCSALRILYVQEDIADTVFTMLFGAMDELRLGNPWNIDTDVGPVIDKTSKDKIDKHCADFEATGKLLKQLNVPTDGTFVAPTVLKVSGIEEIKEEIFGPVLHVATFSAKEMDKVVDDINAKGFGLTFGLHTRVDNRVDQIVHKIAVGNIYVNRNQIGAIVGSQPFGGEGLSGTGPKAGGPHYVKRFTQSRYQSVQKAFTGREINSVELKKCIAQLDVSVWEKDENRLDKLAGIFAEQLNPIVTKTMHRTEEMPGPTGELNLLSQLGRGVLVCLGPDKESVLMQTAVALAQGNGVVIVAEGIADLLTQCQQHNLPVTGCEGQLSETAIKNTEGFAAIVSNASDKNQRQIRKALAARGGALLPLISELDQPERYINERHLCIDTTAAGGNANLIAVAG